MKEVFKSEEILECICGSMAVSIELGYVSKFPDFYAGGLHQLINCLCKLGFIDSEAAEKYTDCICFGSPSYILKTLFLLVDRFYPNKDSVYYTDLLALYEEIK